MRLLAAALALLLTAAQARAQELTLSVAISMKDAVEELGGRFTKARRGVTLRYNWGSSGELQKQIEAAWFGQKAPKDALDTAAQDANRILKEKAQG